MLQYSMIIEENLKTQFASKYYHRRLTAHTMEHLKLYVTQRREEKARFGENELKSLLHYMSLLCCINSVNLVDF